jgi:hypothetical protein
MSNRHNNHNNINIKKMAKTQKKYISEFNKEKESGTGFIIREMKPKAVIVKNFNTNNQNLIESINKDVMSSNRSPANRFRSTGHHP